MQNIQFACSRKFHIISGSDTFVPIWFSLRKKEKCFFRRCAEDKIIHYFRIGIILFLCFVAFFVSIVLCLDSFVFRFVNFLSIDWKFEIESNIVKYSIYIYNSMINMCVAFLQTKANGIGDDIYIREKPPKLGKSSCRKFLCLFCSTSCIYTRSHTHRNSIHSIHPLLCITRMQICFSFSKLSIRSASCLHETLFYTQSTST